MSRARLSSPIRLGAACAALLAVGLSCALADPAPTPVAPAQAPAPTAAPAPAPLTVTRPVTSPDAGMDDAMSRREENRAAMMDARLAELHAGLQLGAGQEALWPPVADAIRGFAKLHGRRWRETLANADNSVDGLKLQGVHMVEVGTAMGKLAGATGPLLASLTPDQKSRLPMLLRRVRPRKVMARAFELPADTQQDGAGTGDRGMRRQGGMGQGRMGQGQMGQGQMGQGQMGRGQMGQGGMRGDGGMRDDDARGYGRDRNGGSEDAGRGGGETRNDRDKDDDE